MAASNNNTSLRSKVIKVPGKPFKEASSRLPWPRKSDPDENGKIVDIGVDVVAKREDIKKIIGKFFRVEGVPMEELQQEVYLAIIHKNTTKSAHDSRKSSFGHYVYMVANNVCINLVHKSRRYEKERESLDSPQGHEDSRSLLDTVEAPPPEPDSEVVTEQMQTFESHMRRSGMWEQARYVSAVRTGVSPDIIREALTWGNRKVSSKTIRDIRNQVREAHKKISAEAF